jgi:peptidylprolyl isomerase
VKRLLLLLLAVAALAAGCGDDDEKKPADSGGAATTEAAAEPDPALQKKPKVEVPKGSPPKELQIRDIIKGTGPEATVGAQITVQYVGVSYSTGKQFDASWDRGAEPFPLQLGAGMVIPGWDQGLVGMRQGGRRELIIPPDLAYGAQGQPPDIKPNETLIFVVDAVEVGG